MSADPRAASTSPEDLGAILRRRHLPALDGLRAVAVFVVITYHFFGGPIPGNLGVSAFFVLSGFLITWLLLKEYDADGTISLRNFYTRRVLRIFPAYYFFVAVSFLIDCDRDAVPGLEEAIQPRGASRPAGGLRSPRDRRHGSNRRSMRATGRPWRRGRSGQW